MNNSKKNNDRLYLTPLKPLKKLKENEYIAFDCETYTSKNKFYMCCFYGKNIRKAFFKKEEAIKFIEENHNKIFVATNLQFDYTVLFDKLQHRTRYNFSGSLIFKIDYIYKNKKKIIFLDSLSFIPCSLKALGKIVGVEKTDPPWDLSEQRKPKNRTEQRALQKYCMNDAKVTYKFFEKIKEFTLKEKIVMKNTISSLALELFRRKYLDVPYKIENTEAMKIIFKGYYGGRTEVFKRGTYKNINYYDFNSLYPSQMLNAMPDPNHIGESFKPQVSTILKYEGVTKVKIKIPYMYIPPLPYRSKEGKLLFPYGTITGYWTNLEIRNALKYGAKIIKIYKGIYYTKNCFPFKKFIHDMYNKRLSAKKKQQDNQIFYKLMMNSSYGKFGFKFYETNEIKLKTDISKKDIEESYDIIDLQDYDKNLSELFSIVIKKDQWDNKTHYSIPIWSTYITAYGRIKMFEAMQNPNVQKNICYADTDSILLKDNHKMPVSNKLGDLSLECDTVPEGTFIKPKFYYLKKARIKGFSGIKTKKQFFDAVKNKSAKQTIFTKVKTAIKSKTTGKHGKLSFNEVLTINKSINLEDTKRNWEEKPFSTLKEYSEKFTQQDSKPIKIIEE